VSGFGFGLGIRLGLGLGLAGRGVRSALGACLGERFVMRGERLGVEAVWNGAPSCPCLSPSVGLPLTALLLTKAARENSPPSKQPETTSTGPETRRAPRARLCAMVSTVQSAKADRMVAWMSASLAASTLEVASSSTRTRVDRSSARAMHSSWRCPAERLVPPSWMDESRPDWGRAGGGQSGRVRGSPGGLGGGSWIPIY
jgi:hypothetical protein